MASQTNEPFIRIRFKESTIKKIESITNKRFNNNGEKLILEILKRVKK